MMTNEHESKRDFVTNELSACMRATDYGVMWLDYEVVAYDEIVTIHYKGGGKRRVFVTGDSKMAIIADVMKVIW